LGNFFHRTSASLFRLSTQPEKSDQIPKALSGKTGPGLQPRLPSNFQQETLSEKE